MVLLRRAAGLGMPGGAFGGATALRGVFAPEGAPERPKDGDAASADGDAEFGGAPEERLDDDVWSICQQCGRRVEAVTSIHIRTEGSSVLVSPIAMLRTTPAIAALRDVVSGGLVRGCDGDRGWLTGGRN